MNDLSQSIPAAALAALLALPFAVTAAPVPQGATLTVAAGQVFAPADGTVEAMHVVVYGTLAAPPGRDLVVRADFLEIHGEIRGSAPIGVAGVLATAAAGRIELSGQQGADAPDVLLEARTIWLAPDARLTAASGADGAPVTVDRSNLPLPPADGPVDVVRASGGDGGAGGDIRLRADRIDLAGLVEPGVGGNGGSAVVDYRGTAASLSKAEAIGGDGGRTGALVLAAPALRLRDAPVQEPGSAARGGDATAYAPSGLSPPRLSAATVASCSNTPLGPAGGVVVRGADGVNTIGSNIHGADADADGTHGQNGCSGSSAGRDGINGQQGGSAEAIGGRGADGACAGVAAASKHGGNGGDASATGGDGGNGGNGADGADGQDGVSDTFGVFYSPGTAGGNGGKGGNGARGGAATATGGRGGDGAPVHLFSPAGCPNAITGANGGHGGTALATGGWGGNGGAGGDGGDGGDGCGPGAAGSAGAGGSLGNSGSPSATGGQGGSGTGALGNDGISQSGTTGFAPSGSAGQAGSAGSAGQQKGIICNQSDACTILQAYEDALGIGETVLCNNDAGAAR